MNRLEVRTSRMHVVAAVVLGIFLIPLSVLSLVMGVSSGNAVQLGIGVMMLAVYGGVVALMRRGRSRSVKYFSDQGLERNDGRFLPWTELERVVHQIRTVANEKRLWRTEIHFRNGDAAWVLPMRVQNFGEVSSFVRHLPCEQAEQEV
ncbi:MAG TPA: hypothetical protein VFS20_32215 [Longimicrobium sp.]|nr:hypothetical protein [Longimicrobium sp.]